MSPFAAVSSVSVALLAWAPTQLAHAQSERLSLSVTGANVVRFDLLGPLALNLGYNMFADRAFVFPLMFFYERRVGSRFSIGLEGLVNGGVPDEKRIGVTLSARCYLRHDASLSGLYVAPQLAYRRVESAETLNNTIVPNRVVTTGNRVGTGLLAGWQQPVGRARRVLLDYAVGAVHWTPLGTDDATGSPPPLYPAGTYEGINRAGWWLDCRLGIGYQF